MTKSILLRPLKDVDVHEHADLLYSSFNSWYWKHGWGKDYFGCSPQETSIFYEIYNDLSPDCSIAAFDNKTGRMMGSCFYHPREHHVSLGIMSVHPNYGGRGIGRQLVNHIIDYTKKHDFKSCRLVSSAINMDSFSLYNRSGFIPRVTYHDMVINVPESGLGDASVKGEDNIREASLADIEKMGELEMEISGIKREIDYRYAIENPRKVLHALIYENNQNGIDGFMISVKHPALNMLGPCVARNEEIAIALIRKEIERFKGTWVLFSIPMDKRKMVEQMYAWKAINVETHLKEVWGEFPGFNGISMPSFLPETG
ncbi:MAG: GNAT family N-acetyltransferase [Candidatus Marinimicrobia bacterium]|jgi:GNAT superfamily N-acetyltransferase|nr:GNAT family N-acetyltransferase [Candidatus Neomarinimicrobiota bacterium]MBT3682114.1 GNAT family N-acetyltransferase [Candidatus Neomarinimicrobiota bacterium]MBT3895244.1 GNAT family N-acetyltransferase [Candidatus Neomarinimicrobiota bacterium]MBT4536972.1 GNAT family N-acetyltransferase [Candidatus Neomarinimicrobiota bacterium]MBT5210543.1 GNAT family N-acetyltransferase [Candidatus Neomarinimicrobiota bacterium]